MKRNLRTAGAPRSTGTRVLWWVLAAVVFGGLIALGNWQVHRLGWKLNLIHDVNTRVHAPPVAAPGPVQWPTIASGHQQYLHVRLRGRFVDGAQTLVHGTSDEGYGFWVLAPLRTDRGFVVLVNRGYIPATLAQKRVPPPRGEVTLTGLLRFSEPGGGFMRLNKPDTGQWYSRDVAAIAAARDLPAHQVAPYFVDADTAAKQGDGPTAGLTVIRFPNHHLGYAITWYLLALIVLLAAAYVGRDEYRLRQRARRDSTGGNDGAED